MFLQIYQLAFPNVPRKHTTSFQRPYNVHNVKTTSYGCRNNVVCVLGRFDNLTDQFYVSFIGLTTGESVILCLLRCCDVDLTTYEIIRIYVFFIDLTTGQPVTFMCLPCSITASCMSSTNHTTASLTFSKVVLTAEETRVYQIPWEKQQKKIHKNNHRSLCFCWCCVCTCLQ